MQFGNSSIRALYFPPDSYNSFSSTNFQFIFFPSTARTEIYFLTRLTWKLFDINSVEAYVFLLLVFYFHAACFPKSSFTTCSSAFKALLFKWCWRLMINVFEARRRQKLNIHTHRLYFPLFSPDCTWAKEHTLFHHGNLLIGFILWFVISCNKYAFDKDRYHLQDNAKLFVNWIRNSRYRHDLGIHLTRNERTSAARKAHYRVHRFIIIIVFDRKLKIFAVEHFRPTTSTRWLWCQKLIKKFVFFARLIGAKLGREMKILF